MSCSITRQDVSLVKSSWSLVSTNAERTGIELLRLFFKRHPDYLQLFGEFADVNVDQIEADRRVARHAIRIVKAIDTLVNNLDDEQPEKSNQLLGPLRSLVDSHVKRRSIGYDKFSNLGKILVQYIVSQQPTNAITDVKLIEQSWNKFYTLILDVVAGAEEQMRQQNC
ncbi:Cytoglobin-2 [Fragariocoptes setiger]|uniref:Cytoglobin-2 n=1 Tax=Fragariocoptes setiger TaxID=1670756 RepID=A0ABQ7S5F9_9ACAR|nr:Cytoglobin-2 [Fragariocoptes setiger]